MVSHILTDIKSLLAHLPQVSIAYEPRETNRVAHSLTSQAYDQSIVDQTWFSTAPDRDYLGCHCL